MEIACCSAPVSFACSVSATFVAISLSTAKNIDQLAVETLSPEMEHWSRD
jgi:hypothetical protein